MEILVIIDWLHAGDFLVVDKEDVVVFVAEALILLFIVGGISKEAASDCERISTEKVRSALCS